MNSRLVGHRHHDVRQTGGHLLRKKRQFCFSGHSPLPIGGQAYDTVQLFRLLRCIKGFKILQIRMASLPTTISSVPESVSPM